MDLYDRVGKCCRFYDYGVLSRYAQPAEGRFAIPIARTLALEDWREALDLSLNKRAHGKPVLLLDSVA